MKTSEYLLNTAKEHIEGNITIDEVQKRILNHYKRRKFVPNIARQIKKTSEEVSLTHAV